MESATEAPTGSEEEKEERCWSNLQVDILSMIKSHLFGADRIWFHAVCKAWNSVPSQVRWLPSPARQPSEVTRFPTLMFSGRNTSVCKFFNPLLNKTHSIIFPELANAQIRFSKGGWLLVTQGNSKIFFFNPFTKEKINLPDLPVQEHKFTEISFSSLPTAPDCIVLAISILCLNEVKFSCIRRGESCWKTFEECSDTNVYMPCYSNPVFFDGAFHCLSEKRGSLSIFDPTNDEDFWIELKELEKPIRKPVDQCYLTECDGELMALYEGHLGRTIDVFKLDKSAMIWKRVNNLGDMALFLSPRASISAPPSRGVASKMENKVYFPRFKGEDGVFYSLSTGKFHSFDLGYTAENFIGTKQQMHCAWIEPSFEKHSIEDLLWC
ncbi:hypothetical protein SLA2020_051060 [Shorea laevis]